MPKRGKLLYLASLRSLNFAFCTKVECKKP